MEKDKSRGIKHIKDKRKYKGNTTKTPKHVAPKSKPYRPYLDSNWDRYEIEGNEHEHRLSSSTDFALLSNAPISTGSHFQFKSDKILEKEYEQEENNLFSLNLDLLHKSILTIPFYERLNMPKEYFKEPEIRKMDEEAAINLSSYQTLFKKTHAQKDITPISNLSVDKSYFKKDETIEKTKNVILCDEKRGNISELIGNCSIDDVYKDLSVPLVTEPTDDLEQWLDDFLED